MSKNFAEIAHDVIAGVGLLQKGEPEIDESFWGSLDRGDGLQRH